jgi:hypothetical protein
MLTKGLVGAHFSLAVLDAKTLAETKEPPLPLSSAK